MLGTGVIVPGLAQSAFAAEMDRLGPFEPAPALAVAVSGGADSMALAIAARDWALNRGGSVIALVVDHALRPASGAEARLTVERLFQCGIPARLLTLLDLKPGPALAERARVSRYKVLTTACAEAGIVHLLLGHHLGDQAETLAMRVLRSSQTHGLAGMAALRETPSLRLLRPLLSVDPNALRGLLTERGLTWVEDPSNQNLLTMRARMRRGMATAPITETGLVGAMATAGRHRAREEHAIAVELADRVVIRPEGFALLSPGRVSAGAMAAVIQAISGAAYPPNPAQVTALAAQPMPTTVAGVRLLPAGRFGEGWLVIREEAAIGAPVPATDGRIWDGRFRLVGNGSAGAMMDQLGDDAVLFRRTSDLPSAVLRTMPAVRTGEKLAFVPHLGYRQQENNSGPIVLFSPRRPAAGPGFIPAA